MKVSEVQRLGKNYLFAEEVPSFGGANTDILGFFATLTLTPPLLINNDRPIMLVLDRF